MAHLKCPAREAQDALAAVPHKRFQDVLAGHWHVDADGAIDGRSVCWLYCWAKTGMGSLKAATAADTKSFTASAATVDTTAYTITLAGHGLKTGTAVVYDAGSGTAIGGLTDGTTYYVIASGPDTVKLATTAENANKGTERGQKMIEDSLRAYGAGRSILIDKNGRIIAGNKTAENFGSIGLEDVLVIQTDGTKLVDELYVSAKREMCNYGL